MSKMKRKVQVVIVQQDKQKKLFSLLLLKTNKQRGEFWQNVTGGVDKGEEFRQAALREVFEETNLKEQNIKELTKINEFKFYSQNWNYEAQEEVYFLLTEKKWELKIDPSEHSEFNWYNLFDFPKELIKYKSNVEAIELSIKRVHEISNH